jgi:hypothetical protein
MKRSSRSSRTPVSLSESIHDQLNSYVLAATAAGVGMLALAQPAQGKIIYTSTHKTIRVHQRYNLDLNHDGVSDFTIQLKTTHTRGTSFFSTLELLPRKNNAVAGGYLSTGCGARPSAFALSRGVLVGSKQQFHGKPAVMAFAGTIDGISAYCGPWLNVKNRYLGLKFIIRGKTHFGWARLSVISTNISITSATLTGYAFETIPNKPIIAGKTYGPDDISVGGPDAAVTQPTPEPATLGALAMGAPGLSIWKREESVGAGK